MEEKKLRRAGLDYHDMANVKRHANYASFIATVSGCRVLACTTKGSRFHDQIQYKKNDVLLFGSETHGLPDDVLNNILPEHRLRIPMQPNSRSLNLSNAVAIISCEAWRQNGFIGGI